MIIDFFIQNESRYSFSWSDSSHIPRIGDCIRKNREYDGEKFIVVEITWVHPELIQIIINSI